MGTWKVVQYDPSKPTLIEDVIATLRKSAEDGCKYLWTVTESRRVEDLLPFSLAYSFVPNPHRCTGCPYEDGVIKPHLKEKE